MMSHRGNASQYKLLFHLSDAKTFWKMYSLTEFSRKSYLCCGRYHRQGIACGKSVTRTPPPSRRWATSDGITLFQVEIFQPISTVFCNSICAKLAKHVNLSTTHSLDLKDPTNYYLRIKNQIHALSSGMYLIFNSLFSCICIFINLS